MRILSNYDELIISVDSYDTKRFENLLAYSDCRNELVNKYIQSFGIKNIRKITKNVQAKALKNELEKICIECEHKNCKMNLNTNIRYSKIVHIHEGNIISNKISHDYQFYN